MMRRVIWAKALFFSTLLGAGALVAGAWAVRGGRLGTAQACAAPRAASNEVCPAAAVDSSEPVAAALDLPASAACPEEVRRVVRASGAAGPGAAPELRRLALGSSDPLIAGNAVRALGRVGAVAGDAEVRGLLEDPRPRVRQETVMALGSSGDPQSLRDLIPLLDDEDSTVRVLAIRSIGRIGGPEARDVLESASTGFERTEVERAFLRQALSEIR